MPSSSARWSTRMASSWSSGGPQMPLPVIRIAPKPRRWTGNSPPIAKVPLWTAGRLSSAMVPCLHQMTGAAEGRPRERGSIAWPRGRGGDPRHETEPRHILFRPYPDRSPVILRGPVGAVLGALILLASPVRWCALDAQTSPNDREARAIFAELVGINTTHDRGTARAVRALARRFLAAGFPATDVVIAGPNPVRTNLVVRLRGSGARKPMLLLAHLDVVEARRAEWSLEPFVLRSEEHTSELQSRRDLVCR